VFDAGAEVCKADSQEEEMDVKQGRRAGMNWIPGLVAGTHEDGSLHPVLPPPTMLMWMSAGARCSLGSGVRKAKGRSRKRWGSCRLATAHTKEMSQQVMT
jgi:hypothetical protein